jgi:hypothetical protein
MRLVNTRFVGPANLASCVHYSLLQPQNWMLRARESPYVRRFAALELRPSK